MKKITLFILLFLITGCVRSSNNLVHLENNQLQAVNNDYLKNEVTNNIGNVIDDKK
jgi:uncharacterized protein YcfL